MQSRIEPKIIEEILRLRREGKSYKMISEATGVNHNTIPSICSRYLGEGMPKAKPDREALKARCIQLKEAGMRASEIAKELGIHVSRVYYYLPKHLKKKVGGRPKPKAPQLVIQQVDLSDVRDSRPAPQEEPAPHLGLRDAIRLVANATVKDVLTVFLERGN